MITKTNSSEVLKTDRAHYIYIVNRGLCQNKKEKLCEKHSLRHLESAIDVFDKYEIKASQIDDLINLLMSDEIEEGLDGDKIKDLKKLKDNPLLKKLRILLDTSDNEIVSVAVCPALKKRMESKFRRAWACFQNYFLREFNLELETIGGCNPIHEIKDSKDIQDDSSDEDEYAGENKVGEHKKITIFLASSEELKGDRESIRAFITDLNKEYKESEITFYLETWEHFIDSMAKEGLQNEYNKTVEEADVFVSLFHTKIGERTKDEFKAAWENFKIKGRPHVYTYFKDTLPSRASTKELKNLCDFKEELMENLKHDPTYYSDINDLKSQIKSQINMLLQKNEL